jgi:uncharacterized phage protein (TIGR01671 family)
VREIKFRGKRIDNGEWVYGSYIKASEKHGYIVGYFGNVTYIESEDLNSVKCVCHKVKNETVGQYCGIEENNGRMIWEGDILVPKLYVKMNGDNQKQFRCQVVFSKGVFHFQVNGGLIQELTPIITSLNRGIKAENEYVVIGNIHESN